MAKISVSLFGGTQVEGHVEKRGSYWYVSLFGGTNQDLREADLPEDEPVNINVFTLFGGSKILVPEVVANLCFGGRRRNRLFICGTTSLYAVLTHVTGALRP